ncbi:MAG: hypothetical protein IT555_05680 [Acetobacteraceae bacterium]|nr:hypothetical protein [Acetobacteraceae bacterium]
MKHAAAVRYPPATAPSPLPAMLIDDTPRLPLMLLAGVVLAFSGWLLLSPGVVVSRLMTWDLLFILEGAWRLHVGQVAHGDFHDPLGSLAFRPTELGMRIVGPSVLALIVGKLIVAGAVFVVAVAACARRLPLLPALIFVLFVCGLTLVPTNVGSLIDHFAFAMSYNATGWAGLCVLALILFLPPRRVGGGDWADLAIGLALIVALYYLKITYFIAAVGLLAAALVLCGHIRARRLAWGGAGAIALANAVAPYNWPYLTDILAALQSGAARGGAHAIVLLVSANATELSLYAAALLFAAAFWRAGRVPLRLPAAIAVLLACAVFVFSQNAQLRGLPLGAVAFFLVYDQMRRTLRRRRDPGAVLALLAVLVFPAAIVGAGGFSAVAYFIAARPEAPNHVVARTNMRGLAVPLLQDYAVSSHEKDYSWLRDLRRIDGNVRVPQLAYVRSLLEAAALFDAPSPRPGGIMLLDQVNPMAFILGRPPSRGATLWMDTAFPFQPAERSFAEVAHVLIPKLSTNADLTASALDHYGAYLAAHFGDRTETENWILLSRPAARP